MAPILSIAVNVKSVILGLTWGLFTLANKTALVFLSLKLALILVG